MRYLCDETFKSRFGQRIRQWRKRAGWTQQQLADELGCTNKHISGIEMGRRGASLRVYLALCRLAGLSFDELSQLSNVED